MQFAAMLPLMVAFFMAFGVMNDPEGKRVVIGSLIPFTSLIIVPLRAILGAIPWSQTLLAAVLLARAGPRCGSRAASTGSRSSRPASGELPAPVALGLVLRSRGDIPLQTIDHRLLAHDDQHVRAHEPGVGTQGDPLPRPAASSPWIAITMIPWRARVASASVWPTNAGAGDLRHAALRAAQVVEARRRLGSWRAASSTQHLAIEGAEDDPRVRGTCVSSSSTARACQIPEPELLVHLDQRVSG